MSYKIAVAGPIPRDTIITYKGEVIEKYGCVTHPTIALAKLLDEDGEIIPITHVHKQDKQPIVDLFKDFPNINTTGIYSKDDQGTIIELKFVDQNNRLEKQLSKMPPLSPEDVSPFLDADAFVFVPITDFEVAIDTLKTIKQKSKATVIFDAHGPTTWVDDQGKRLRRYWAEKDEWFPYIDVLKMNLEESQCSWIDKEYGEDFEATYDENDVSHLDEFAAYALNKGIKILYITLDSRGCAVYTKNNGQIIKTIVPSVPVDEVIDTTGCGDSFAGGLAYGLVYHNDNIKAAQYANILGALRTQGKNFEVFKDRKETDLILQKNYAVSK